MLDLQPGVHLDEVELPLFVEEELECARAAIAERLGRPARGVLHLGPELGRDRRRRPLLDQLLVTALDGAVALAQGQRTPVAVAEHLDLHVARADEGALDVERAVPECRLGFAGCRLEDSLQVVRVGHEAHAAAPAPGGGLQEEREADVAGERACLLEARGPIRAGDERQPRLGRAPLGADLVAHDLDRLGPRANEGEVVVLARGRELGPLGQEPPARVHGLAARGRRGGDQRRDVQVALRGRWRADVDGLVGEVDVERVAVGGRVHRHGLDLELVAGSDEADGHLAPVRDQDAAEHRRPPFAFVTVSPGFRHIPRATRADLDGTLGSGWWERGAPKR